MTWRAAWGWAGFLLAGIGIASFALTGGPVLGQLGPDPKAGKDLAEKLCTSCHIVGRQAARASVSADVPSFAEIADKPDQTAEAIAGRIVIPHPPMPQIQLTRKEIGDLTAYIMSLRKP